MSNKIFEAYVKSGMFSLTLSKSMIECLTYLVHRQQNPTLTNYLTDSTTYFALARRGLIEHGIGVMQCWRVTGAGNAVYDLLGEADMIDYDKYQIDAAIGDAHA